MVRLREVREELGFSQRDLSRAAGVTTASISRIENGKAKAHPSTLRKFADAMGVDIREITRGPQMVTFQTPSGAFGLMSVEEMKKLQQQ